MNDGDYWTTLLIDAAAARDDQHLLVQSDPFCEAALTHPLTDWIHQ
jgi:hypothetical protein